MKMPTVITYVILQLLGAVCLLAEANKELDHNFEPKFNSSSSYRAADLRELVVDRETLIWLYKNDSALIDRAFEHNEIASESFPSVSYSTVVSGVTLLQAVAEVMERYKDSRGTNFTVVLFTFHKVETVGFWKLAESPLAKYELSSGDVVLVKAVSDWSRP